MKGLGRRLYAVLLGFVALGLGSAVLQMPESDSALLEQLVQNLPQSGVSHDVTAVLLNYRGYDTFLELVVLLLALLGAWGLSDSVRERRAVPVTPVLYELVVLLVPVLVVVAAYLLWVGSSSPGGAFQAGAVFAGAGVLLSLSNPVWRGPRLEAAAELFLFPGILAFVVVGMIGLQLGGEFLEYPVGVAGSLILVIEGFATLSIAVTLHTLFAGTSRRGSGT